jgi:antitoxin component YwqK of YwqJK toxin-antitoxin module
MGYINFAALIALSLTLSACSRYSSDPMSGEALDERYVHKYGVDVPPDFWQSSGEDGSVISTMPDGTVITRSYRSGLLDGETTYSFPHSSQIQKKEVYSRGIIVRVVELHVEGTPKNEIVFNSPQNGMQTISNWYISGTPKSVERFNEGLLFSAEYFNLANHKDASVENLSGTRLVRDDYGLLISTDTIEGGMLLARNTYHPNNSPKEVIPYLNNSIHGNKLTFHPAGEPNAIEQWSKGRQEGVSIVFFHGEKYSEMPYANGVRQGIERRYRDGNRLVQEVSWNNDQLNGPSVTYIGDTSKTEWYYQGAPITEADYNFIMNRPIVR